MVNDCMTFVIIMSTPRSPRPPPHPHPRLYQPPLFQLFVVVARILRAWADHSRRRRQAFVVLSRAARALSGLEDRRTGRAFAAWKASAKRRARRAGDIAGACARLRAVRTRGGVWRLFVCLFCFFKGGGCGIVFFLWWMFATGVGGCHRSSVGRCACFGFVAAGRLLAFFFVYVTAAAPACLHVAFRWYTSGVTVPFWCEANVLAA